MKCPHCDADITDPLDQFGEKGREVCRACWLSGDSDELTPAEIDEHEAYLAGDLKQFFANPKGWAE